MYVYEYVYTSVQCIPPFHVRQSRDQCDASVRLSMIKISLNVKIMEQSQVRLGKPDGALLS